jgi:hypothetical protein
MRDRAMNGEQFAALAEAYGADIGRWPPAERHTALEVADRPWARAALAAAVPLDAWLDLSRDPAVSDALLARALRAAPRGRAPRNRVIWQGMGFLGVGFSGAAAAMLTMATLPTMLQRPVPVAYDDDDTMFGAVGQGDQ